MQMFRFSGGKMNENPGFQTARGCTALVTGSSGLCGARLVEMLLERGARTVIAFDIAAPDETLSSRFEQVQKKTKGQIIVMSGKDGDLCDDTAVEAAFKAAKKIDVCFHVGALVGPFHDRNKYENVNYHGTVRIINNCKKYKVPKLVYSSSPSTRFTGGDVTGQKEEELPIPESFLALYAETKAYGEKAVLAANSPELLTIAVAPHQVYGPYDNLMLPNLLEVAGNNRLRIFGCGRNKISVCYVDNYAHGMLCGADALYENSPALAKFYIVTDGEPVLFWDFINDAVTGMGFTDLKTKFHLPVLLLYTLAYAANFLGWLLNKKFKLNPFNVKMLVIHRYFSIENATTDLKYEPVKPYSQAWPETIDWFKQNWLPEFIQEKKRKLSKKAE